MIKNIILDIGNVIMDFHPKQYFANMYESEEIGQMMCDLIMQSQVWKDYDLGYVTIEDVKKVFCAKVPALQKEIVCMLDAWLNILRPISYTFKKMEEWKTKGYKIYLLSNLSYDAHMYIDTNYHLFDDVDGYVLSYQEHAVKPDFKIYECLMSRYNLKKEECLFLDDTLVNVTASNAFGIKAIQFTTIEEVDVQLKEILG